MSLNKNAPMGIVSVTGYTDFNGAQIDQPHVSAADHSFVLNTLKGLTGRILTLVEASYSDRDQRKAMKDMVKMIFSNEMDHLSDAFFSSKQYNYTSKHPEVIPEGTLVCLEDVIKGNVPLGSKRLNLTDY